jgi:DNA-3-methyladenine glycosylase
MERLARTFYEGPTTEVAKRLLGKRLVRHLGNTELAGIVVEVEAYRGFDDPASHAFKGRTPRNDVMYGEAGHAYVYFTYGNHYCLNVTTEPVGVPGAVLIRALEPTRGILAMMKNRGKEDALELASGPGKLTKAMCIGRELNGEDLVTSRLLYFTEGKLGRFEWDKSSRIGVSIGADREWRFFVKGSPFVSKGRPSVAPNANP